MSRNVTGNMRHLPNPLFNFSKRKVEVNVIEFQHSENALYTRTTHSQFVYTRVCRLLRQFNRRVLQFLNTFTSNEIRMWHNKTITHIPSISQTVFVWVANQSDVFDLTIPILSNPSIHRENSKIRIRPFHPNQIQNARISISQSAPVLS